MALEPDRLDLERGLALASDPQALALGQDYRWVSAHRSAHRSATARMALEPDRLDLERGLALASDPQALALGQDYRWVSAHRSAYRSAHRSAHRSATARMALEPDRPDLERGLALASDPQALALGQDYRSLRMAKLFLKDKHIVVSDDSVCCRKMKRAMPPSSSSSTALVVANGEGAAAAPPPEEEMELPVDLTQLPMVPMAKTLLLVNNFVANTTRFLNHFAYECEERIARVSTNLTRVEILLAILEAKLDSIPDLTVTEMAPANELELSEGSTAKASALKLKDDPAYATYFTMRRLGMPDGAIEHKMRMDGVDPSILKYFTMQKMGLPEGAIRHKLMMDGVTLDILSEVIINLFTSYVDDVTGEEVKDLRKSGLFKSISRRVNRSMNPSLMRMLSLTFIFLLSQHFIAPLVQQYAHAIYFAIMVTTANDVAPTNMTEEVFTSLMLFVGIVINASIIGSAANLLANLDKVAIARKNQMDSINDYMRFKKVPLALQDKIRRYYEYALSTRIVDPTQTLFADLPDRLKLSLRLTLHDTFIRKVPLFRVCSNAGVIAIVQCLHPVVAMPHEIIIGQGEISILYVASEIARS
ncbi:hypothetical protein P43SY_001080 [Pythium insidiosum]|uniref:Cyclic nucleotide-binding domain-containing protein n=1 Tax=Pythium insidiosum TaxID=114742 RepID=A0AAD5QD13_PYTIN|nr:hypothetical protein P43SY_001080 [Pythium insidiosum]